jgi:hypothetical protein
MIHSKSDNLKKQAANLALRDYVGCDRRKKSQKAKTSEEASSSEIPKIEAPTLREA